MPEAAAGEINRLSISVRDFEKSTSYLRVLDSLNETVDEACGVLVCESLLLSSIVSYARPFSHNEKDEAAEADPKITGDVLEGLSEEELALHKKLIKLRNKAIAHSEWIMNPTHLSENGVFLGSEFNVFSHIKSGRHS